MAWRYRQRFFEGGDVVNPRDWIDNQQEIVGEFNGALTHDNFRRGLFEYRECKKNAFNARTANGFDTNQFDNTSLNLAISDDWNTPQNSWRIDTEKLSWSSIGDGTGPSSGSANRIAKCEFDLAEDGLAMLEFSCWWRWQPGKHRSSTAGFENTMASKRALGEDYYESEISVIGPHTNKLYQAVKFRITANGKSVAESGWRDGAREMDSIYLVAATPVMAGRQVFLAEMKSSFVNPFGVIAAPTDSQEIAASILVDQGGVPGEKSISHRKNPKKVSVMDREIFVNIRKR